jgi:hydrogenase/urease accessory protein HupE
LSKAFYTCRLLLLLLFSAATWQAHAHEVRPALLQIKQTSNNQYEVLWKIPRKGDMLPVINPVFPSWFTIQQKDNGVESGSGAMFSMKAIASKDIHGMTISVNGIQESLIDVLVYVEFSNGEKYSLLLQPAKIAATIPYGSSAASTISTYFKLGVEHILFGFDHLLFVLALLLITKGTRKLIATVTAFTLAHSITLSLSVLGFVGLPGPPVEAVIALSILFLAVELVHHYQGEKVMSATYPWMVAFVFGLLHGFGFAGALAGIGLPQTGVPLALAFFNVGVEAGQLLFIGIVLLVIAGIQKINFTRRYWQPYLAPYSIGSVAAFWVIERVYVMLNFN